MPNSSESGLSRRELLRDAGLVAAATTLAATPFVHAAGNDTINVAIVGCGGRGGGAMVNALSTKGPTKLVAMADVFPERLASSFKNITKSHKDKVDCPEERRFLGFDGYQKAIDCLKPGDVVILTTPPAFRWVQFKYAIEKGINVFMEKPITVDGPSTKKMFALGAESEKKGLKVGVGLMCRHCNSRAELAKRIKDGELGELTLLRAYRQHGPVASFASGPQSHYPELKGKSELLYQIRRFHSFLWASGGCYSDFLIHNIDECCWMKDAFPIMAQASGGRHFRGSNVDQNFDSYSVEYTFADGSKFFLEGRCMDGCHQEFASFAHGTKGSAVISEHGHHPVNCRIYKGQDMSAKATPLWESGTSPDPYQVEWDRLMDSIRNDKPHNEVKRGAEASLVTAMGRMAAHTGQIITREEILNCDHEFAPSVDKLTFESDAPVKMVDGLYPVPQPGRKKRREF
jgi:predicted dehydrogenase